MAYSGVCARPPSIAVDAVLLLACAGCWFGCSRKRHGSRATSAQLRHSQLRDSLLSESFSGNGNGAPPQPTGLGNRGVVYVVMGLGCTVAAFVTGPELASQKDVQFWVRFCAGWSVGACFAALPVLNLVMRQMHTLRTAADPTLRLPPEQRERVLYCGVTGVAMFVYGVVDLVQDVWLAIEVQDDRILFFTVVSTTVATMLTSVLLGFRMLHEIQADADIGEDASAWMLVPRQQQIAAAVVILSASRIESLSILRLRLCGTKLLEFPMGAKHFFFIQSAGAYHLVMEEIPHLLVSAAQHQKGKEWTPVIVLTVVLGVFGCVHMSVRALLLLMAWASRGERRALPLRAVPDSGSSESSERTGYRQQDAEGKISW